MPRDNHRKLPDTTPKLPGKIKPLSKFGYTDFMKLAANSFRTNNFGRAVDNCRLAMEIAERVKDLKGMAEAYDLWINSLIAEKKYSAIKKLCCEARSKVGNYLDLTYYEFRMARDSGESQIAGKLAAEYMEIKNKITSAQNIWGIKTIDRAAEVQAFIDSIPAGVRQNQPNLEMD
jgi:hypothetical protein